MKNIEQIIRNLKKTIAGKGNPETISALKAEAFSLYAIFDDDSESLLESLDEIVEAFDMGVDVGIEIGHIKKPKVGTWFHKAEKILKDGHWYAKITDINNTNV